MKLCFSVEYISKICKLFYLHIFFDSVKNRYSLRISDNGIGVLNSDLPFVFEKGFTGDNPNRKQSTGIGLYLVKKLCDELQIELKLSLNMGRNL
ncbi:ATP-binding protein [Psychrobacillus sp. FSL H8-0483]|uniref:ATP-binding protein n=1 Tax=Psychrobacillus sp. FSL H8-0483 TaxID=2921389 RepID=UPI00315AD569